MEETESEQKEGGSSSENNRNKAGADKKPKKFLNGWTKEQERLMAEWSDIATCYRWLHDQSEKIFHVKTLWITLPVIILSTLGGTANFGIQSLFKDETQQKYASFGIGSISLLAGLLTTIGNYLRYPQFEESNRVASIAWGKFQRLIAIELALSPLDRMDSLDFLKICRSDLDRLIEQSPPIPQDAINSFDEKFGSINDLKKPDICGSLVHTNVFESSETRLKQLAVDASLMLRHRKNALNEILSPQIQSTIKSQVTEQLHTALDMNREQLMEELEMKRAETQKLKEETDRSIVERKKKISNDIENEKKHIRETDTKKIPTNNALFSQSMPSLDIRTSYNKYSSIGGGRLHSIKIDDTTDQTIQKSSILLIDSPEIKNQIIIPLIPGGNTSDIVENNSANENINPPPPLIIDEDHMFQLE